MGVDICAEEQPVTKRETHKREKTEREPEDTVKETERRDKCTKSSRDLQ